MHAAISTSSKVGCRINCGRDICKGSLLKLFLCEASNGRVNVFSSRLKEMRTRKYMPFNTLHLRIVTAVRTGAAIFSSHHRLYFECKLLVFSNLTGATDTWVFTTQTSLGQHSLRSTLRRKKKKTNRRRTRALYSDATG